MILPVLPAAFFVAPVAFNAGAATVAGHGHRVGAQAKRIQPKGIDDGCTFRDTMSYRIRHCISCPHCRTRYLIGFSPYANGSYLLSTSVGSLEEYTLYCSCRRFPVPSRWRDSEIKACEVSHSAIAAALVHPRRSCSLISESRRSSSPHSSISNRLDGTNENRSGGGFFISRFLVSMKLRNWRCHRGSQVGACSESCGISQGGLYIPRERIAALNPNDARGRRSVVGFSSAPTVSRIARVRSNAHPTTFAREPIEDHG